MGPEGLGDTSLGESAMDVAPDLVDHRVPVPPMPPLPVVPGLSAGEAARVAAVQHPLDLIEAIVLERDDVVVVDGGVVPMIRTVADGKCPRLCRRALLYFGVQHHPPPRG